MYVQIIVRIMRFLTQGKVGERGSMDRLGGEQQGEVSSVRQVAIASLVGTALEWYDYFLFGTAAALIFNELFFPA